MSMNLKIDCVVFPVSSEASYALDDEWRKEMMKACVLFAMKKHDGKIDCEQTRNEINATAKGCYEWLKCKGVVI